MTKEQTTKSLLDSVSKDVSNLRRDVASLFSHTGRRTIPEGARELADYGKDALHAGGEFAATQFRNFRKLRSHQSETSAGIVGGLILLGAVGVGIYYLCKSDCGNRCVDEEGSNPDTSPETSLPCYIS